MTGNFFLDWAALALSLANVILLLWLGLTVLLNAERRSWDVWLAGSGLLLGGAFFVSHTAILGVGPRFISAGLIVWWYVGWIPVVMLPFGWYVMMLWYAGYWRNLGRQRNWLLLAITLLVSLAGLLLFASPLPSFDQMVLLQLPAPLTIGGMPVILVIYPLYVLLCIGQALQALRHPAPSPRMMGDQARRRARPWLIGATLVQLLVCLLVVGVTIGVLSGARQPLTIDRYTSMTFIVAWFDLLSAGLIGLAVILLGQAIVSYAVFTGKTLPRHELQRQWHTAIILAVGYGTVVGWSLTARLRPIYSLLLTTLLMVIFFALQTWRAYTWRERYIRQLRPFVASQHLYDHLLTATSPTNVDVTVPFRSLCQDILGARHAYLIALGPLAPLVPALAFPAHHAPHLSSLSKILPLLDSPGQVALAIEPAQAGGARWAVPLWSERGLIGLLLLGPKGDDSPYTQEELEIARASGERLVDTQASTEITHRLMTIQRQRLTESRLLDRQTRQVLHDDVLPQIHAALLALSATANRTTGKTTEVITLLTEAHQQISNLLNQIPITADTTLVRRGLVGALRQLVESELAHAFDGITWHVEPEAEQVARRLSPLTAEVMLYAAREALRNAARHGRGDDPSRPLHLSLNITAQPGLSIQVEDDGVGLAAAGVSANGSGQGLALHSTMLAVVGGTLDVESMIEAYTRVTVSLPEELSRP